MRKNEKLLDYYSLMGVAATASADEIKKAYRKMALENHPDRNVGNSDAEEHFKAVSVGYQILKDETKRTVYDSRLKAQRNAEKAAADDARKRQESKQAPPTGNKSQENNTGPKPKTGPTPKNDPASDKSAKSSASPPPNSGPEAQPKTEKSKSHVSYENVGAILSIAALTLGFLYKKSQEVRHDSGFPTSPPPFRPSPSEAELAYRKKMEDDFKKKMAELDEQLKVKVQEEKRRSVKRTVAVAASMAVMPLVAFLKETEHVVTSPVTKESVHCAAAPKDKLADSVKTYMHAPR